MPASRRAMVMARVAPRPVGSGAEIWNASAVSAAPSTSAWMVAPRARACSAVSSDHDPRALAEQEAVPVTIERPRRVLRVIVALGQRAHVGQRRERDGQQGRLGAAREHHVDLAPLDHPQAVQERDDRAGAGGDLGDDRTGEAVLHRQQAGGHRARQRRDGERADLSRALGVQRGGAVDDLLLAAAAGIDRDRDPVTLLQLVRLEVQARVRDRFLAGGHAEVDEATHPAGHLAVHGDGRVEALDLGRDAHVVSRTGRSG